MPTRYKFNRLSLLGQWTAKPRVVRYLYLFIAQPMYMQFPSGFSLQPCYSAIQVLLHRSLFSLQLKSHQFPRLKLENMSCRLVSCSLPSRSRLPSGTFAPWVVAGN